VTNRRSTPDRGLAVWHVTEDPTTYNSSQPPPGIAQTDWDVNLLAGSKEESKDEVDLVGCPTIGASSSR
jgi:hypothetical protein